MQRVFLETSALIELNFGNQEVRERVSNSYPSDCALISSRYVIYEIAKGFLSNLILLHNKAHSFTKLSEMVGYTKAMRFRTHFQGTALGEIQAFLEGNNIGKTDNERLIMFRSFLRGRIRRGWREVNQSIPSPLNGAGCREDLKAPTINKDGLYEIELKKNLCGKNTNCGIKSFSKNNRESLEAIRTALSSILSSDIETQNRIKALRELYRNPNNNFAGKDCWHSGDAIISVEAPKDSLLVSKNKKHIEPIAKCISQSCAFYS
jgi:hypothetical protein